VLKRVTLESGLLLGGALFLAGFAGCAWVTVAVGSSDSARCAVRQVLFWAIVAVLGIADYFASFSEHAGD